MTTQFVEGRPPSRVGEGEVRSLEIGGAGSLVEAIGAAGAIVLSILGLAGAMPGLMVAVATVVLGAAILIQAGAVGARFEKLLRQTATTERGTAQVEVGTGMSAASAAGIAGIVLGVLALLGISPLTLCAVAIIAFGGGMLLESAAVARFRSLSWDRYGISDTTRRIFDEAVGFSAGAEVLVGIGAIVLGILALLGMQPLTLVLVGLLAVGGAALLSGSALGARMFGILRHAS